jgi:tetratricopeptide (TPR) repeat protein
MPTNERTVQDNDKYIQSWEKAYVGDESRRACICGELFYTLGRSKASYLMFRKALQAHDRLTPRLRVLALLRLANNCLAAEEVKAGIKWLNKAMKYAADTDLEGLSYELSLTQGWALDLIGKRRQALDILKQFEGEREGDLPLKTIAEAMYMTGIIAAFSGKKDEMIIRVTRALELYRLIGDVSGISSCLNSLASRILNEGDFDKAEPLLEEAYRFTRKFPDSGAYAQTLGNLGVWLRPTRPFLALAAWESALELFKKSGAEGSIAITLYNIGKTYHELGQVIDAVRYYVPARMIFEQRGDVTAEIIDRNLELLEGRISGEEMTKWVSYLKETTIVRQEWAVYAKIDGLA